MHDESPPAIRLPPLRDKATKRGGVSTRHKELIQCLCERDNRVTERGFAKNVIGALELEQEGRAEFRAVHGGLLPDAYLIDAENQVVVLWEAVVTHDIPEHKLAGYTNLWFLLDGWGWTLCLVRIGMEGREDAIDLCSLFYEAMAKMAQGREVEPPITSLPEPANS